MTSILVIDDDEYIRNAIAEFLQSEGYKVSAAETGEKGVELLKDNHYEIVITDLKMPGISGLEVLKHVKDNYPETDVTVITAHGTIENAVEAMKLGAYDYITKTFDIAELDLIVRRCLEKQKLAAEVSELKELVNLYEVSKAISSIMGLDELLKLILKLACDTLSADGGSIMLYDQKTEKLVVRAALGTRKDVIVGKKIMVGERVAGYAAKEKKSISLHGRLNSDPRFAHLEEFDNIKSSITVPLLRKGKLLGVINLNRREPVPVRVKTAEFSQRDLNLLSIFAAEAAIAIENTNLFTNLEQEKEELNATFAGMADGAIITDAQLNIVKLNHSAEKLLDIPQEECLGKNLAELIPDFKPSVSWGKIKKQTNITIGFELVRKKGKSLFLEVLSTKIVDQKNNLIGKIMVLRDVTDEKKEEQVKKNFLSLVSHKLKTPLTAIIGYAQILMGKEKSLDVTSKQALMSINNQGDLLSQLVDKLLRFTLLESESTELDRKKVVLNVLVEKCLKSLNPLIVSNQVEVTVDPVLTKLPPVWVDDIKIQEVLENLIENAIKFNDKKKKSVKITGRLLDSAETSRLYGAGQVFSQREPVGTVCEIEVIDNGPGIPSEEQKKIFQKFYQIEEHFTGQIEGVGLGLAVVKRIIELHNGRIWVESTLEKGSKFCFTLLKST